MWGSGNSFEPIRVYAKASTRIGRAVWRAFVRRLRTLFVCRGDHIRKSGSLTNHSPRYRIVGLDPHYSGVRDLLHQLSLNLAVAVAVHRVGPDGYERHVRLGLTWIDSDRLSHFGGLEIWAHSLFGQNAQSGQGLY